MGDKANNRSGLVIVLIVAGILALSCSCIFGAMAGGLAVGLIGYRTAENDVSSGDAFPLSPDEIPERIEPWATPQMPELPFGQRVIIVTNVFEDSPAEQAGLHSGDVILLADGQEIEELEDLYRIVNGREPGDTLALLILRNGRERDVEVRLGQDPDDASQAWLGIEYRLIPSGRFQFEESD